MNNQMNELYDTLLADIMDAIQMDQSEAGIEFHSSCPEWNKQAAEWAKKHFCATTQDRVDEFDRLTGLGWKLDLVTGEWRKDQ